MSEPIFTLQNISKYYTTGGSVVAGLVDVNLSFGVGEFVAITGESGSGKSTLAHVLGGIIPYDVGELSYNGSPTSHYDSADWEQHRRDAVSFISQSYGLLYGNTVFDNVLSSLLLSGTDTNTAKKETEAILRRVELWELRTRRAAKLSSGQKQRLSIARALAKPAPILIADEPTGNLDPENSEKVINLLADAAKERLVILITHEFSEAEAYATRRIILRDGRVITDAALRPAYSADTNICSRTAKQPRGLARAVTALSLRARPVWVAIMCIFFSLIAFSVFAFLGTFIAALDDTDTRIYDDSAFMNGDKRRIAVMRGDGAPLTEDDYETILGVKHIESLERFGYIKDTNICYRKGVDYDVNYFITGNIETDYVQHERVSLYGKETFMQTVPLLGDDSAFLTDGRLPENIHEVVTVGDEYEIGDSFDLFIHDYKYWNITQYIRYEVTVVGTTDYGTGVYLHDDIGAMITSALRGDGMIYSPVYESYMNTPQPDADGYCYVSLAAVNMAIPTHFIIVTDPDDPTKILSIDRVFSDGNIHGLIDYSYVTISDDIFGTNRIRYTILGQNNSNHIDYLEVSEEIFERYVADYRASDQVSVTITDYAYTDRVINKLYDLGYAAVSPYKLGSTTQDEELVNERLQTLTVCLLALVAITVLAVIVTRAMFGLQTESYKLLSDIGLSKRTAKQSLFLQNLPFTVIGQIIGLTAVFVCERLGVERIIELLKYLTVNEAVLLSAIHLLLSLLTALNVMRVVSRRVYKKSEKDTDLDWSVIREEEMRS